MVAELRIVPEFSEEENPDVDNAGNRLDGQVVSQNFDLHPGVNLSLVSSQIYDASLGKNRLRTQKS